MISVEGFAQEEVSLKWFVPMGSTQLRGELPAEGLGTPQEGCSWGQFIFLCREDGHYYASAAFTSSR